MKPLFTGFSPIGCWCRDFATFAGQRVAAVGAVAAPLCFRRSGESRRRDSVAAVAAVAGWSE